MKTIIYLLQVSACTGIFYAFYFLLLRRMTFFKLNRWYLVGTLLLSFIIPAINLPVDATHPPAIMQPVVFVNKMQLVEEPIQAIQFASRQAIEHRIDWVKLIQTAYLAIAIMSVVHLLFTLLVFARRMKNKELMQIGNVKVLRGSKTLGNSSFFNVLFINDDELEPHEIKQIITHELLHVKLMHSADRLLARVVLIVLWFNPFTYCYIRSIEENHEFEVDRIAAGEADKSMYATLLFKLSVSGQSYLMHRFSKVPLKSRIAMLFNKPTSNMKKAIYALVLPIVAISCLAFANLESKNPVKRQFFNASTKTDTVLMDTVKKYRQKIKRTPAQKIADDRSTAEFRTYTKSADSKYKNELAKRVQMKLLTYKVVGIIDSTVKLYHFTGYKLTQGEDEFALRYRYRLTKSIQGLFKVGDEIQLQSSGAMWTKEFPLIIEPALIKKDEQIIFQSTKNTLRKSAFLYEVNRVRYANGLVTNIKKYPNGKWKSEVMESNGFNINFNIKLSAPEFTNIKQGDNVTFRFVHEVKTGEKDYTVDDWVAISNDNKFYGVKNPDFFHKFYEKI
ncbi:MULTISPECIES: M56 family metallopeptidase [unclassified Mucilaginibacter]|uniref:M56 family metallopeptidase n=1 Tax=unclassified Mucilaginibacter TaxID=2617802 RepID=UPI002AC89ED5|nr:MULTISPECIES: M56 family metallopeptidase [unclassified Mucilaginibacter]MEB0260809.1 M56 family metallopeptidase [Mucilaginibacter sp. 10I4]MEB0279024.1 M56 family metallopeptidase [Mucilaginibacter sp. 10B2]MEB0299957.1 M56 family metallopeptidase [Mucilaginibacter sp. 5C4]WPX22202.1 M56 family metallopeptidase [Mucilaginibacter sp. 5C4]